MYAPIEIQTQNRQGGRNALKDTWVSTSPTHSPSSGEKLRNILMRDHTVIVLAMYKYKTEDQGWKFFLLLLRSSLFCSKLTRRSLQNSESLKKFIFFIFFGQFPPFL